MNAIADTLEQRERVHLRAYGTSMLPAIQPGDLLSFRSLRDDETPATGAIVLTRRDRRLFAHRLHARTSAGWITRGDSLDVDDPPIADTDLLGVLASHVPAAALPKPGHSRLIQRSKRLAARLIPPGPVRRLLARFLRLSGR